MDRKRELATMEPRGTWLLITDPYQDQKCFGTKLNHPIDQADGWPMAKWRLINTSDQRISITKSQFKNEHSPSENRGAV